MQKMPRTSKPQTAKEIEAKLDSLKKVVLELSATIELMREKDLKKVMVNHTGQAKVGVEKLAAYALSAKLSALNSISGR